MYSIGLDVSKSTIAVHIAHNNTDLEIENTPKGIKGLYAKLKKSYKQEIDRMVFVYEPTGSYSSLLDRFCHRKSIRVFSINPKQARNYAKAIGMRNKSDRVDARVLAKAIGIARESEIKVPSFNAAIEEMKELMGYYAFTVKQRVKAANHLESIEAKGGSRYIVSDLKKRIALLKKQESEILEKIKTIIRQDAQLKQGFENIKSIPGIGDVTAITLLHLFMRYEDTNQAQIVSLAGLDPIEKSSGASVRGRTKISKAGSSIYRSTLFMSAMVAIRYNDKMKMFYDRLKSSGKHTTAAQVAVMRKLLVIAHSLYKNNKTYKPDVDELASGQGYEAA